MLHHPADLPGFLKKWRELAKRSATEPAVAETIAHLLGQKEAVVRDALTRAGSDWIQISYLTKPAVSDEKRLFHGQVQYIPDYPECRPKFVIETREGRREELYFAHVEWMDWIKPSYLIVSSEETRALRKSGMAGKIPALVKGSLNMNGVKPMDVIRVGYIQRDGDVEHEVSTMDSRYLRCLTKVAGRGENRLEFTDGSRCPSNSVPLQDIVWIARAHAP